MCNAFKSALADELGRIEEDCTHSGKSHYNAADRWRSYHFWLGVPSTILSAIAGIAFFEQLPQFGATLATAVAILAGLLTFLKPSERAAAHKASGDEYLALRNNSRFAKNVRLHLVLNDQAAVQLTEDLASRRDQLNNTSPQFSQADRKKARRGIEDGEASHLVDDRSN